MRDRRGEASRLVSEPEVVSDADVLDDVPTRPWAARPVPLPALLRVEEVAELLRVNRKSAFAAVEAGELPGVARIRRSIRVSGDAMLDWMRGQGGVSRSRRNR
jgi:excisionase family DNA binding protein